MQSHSLCDIYLEADNWEADTKPNLVRGFKSPDSKCTIHVDVLRHQRHCMSHRHCHHAKSHPVPRLKWHYVAWCKYCTCSKVVMEDTLHFLSECYTFWELWHLMWNWYEGCGPARQRNHCSAWQPRSCPHRSKKDRLQFCLYIFVHFGALCMLGPQSSKQHRYRKTGRWWYHQQHCVHSPCFELFNRRDSLIHSVYDIVWLLLSCGWEGRLTQIVNCRLSCSPTRNYVCPKKNSFPPC